MRLLIRDGEAQSAPCRTAFLSNGSFRPIAEIRYWQLSSVVVFLAALLAASDLPSRPKLRHLNDRELSAISAKCRSPRTWLRYSSSGELHLRPNQTAKYQQVDCVIGELKRLQASPMGFVGNELP